MIFLAMEHVSQSEWNPAAAVAVGGSIPKLGPWIEYCIPMEWYTYLVEFAVIYDYLER